MTTRAPAVLKRHLPPSSLPFLLLNFWLSASPHALSYAICLFFFFDPGTKRTFLNKYLVLGYPLTELEGMLWPYTSAAGAPTAWCGNACHCQPFPLPGSLPILSPPAAACPFSCLSVPPTHHHPSKTCRLSDTHNSNTHHHHHHHHQNGQMAGSKKDFKDKDRGTRGDLVT